MSWSGFVAWVTGPGGTAAFGLLVLALGMILGWCMRGQQDRRDRERWLAERAGRRAAGQFRAMRLDPLPPRTREGAMARRTHPVYRQPASLGPSHDLYEARLAELPWPDPEALSASDQFAAIREAGRQAFRVQQECDASVELYPGQHAALAAPRLLPEDEALLAGINGRLDTWLAENVYQTEES